MSKNIIRKKEGLYSDNHFFMDSIQSLISGDRIFTGNQPDEFGISGIVNPGDKVLLLGLGFGASLRPLIAGVKDIKLTAIDNDPSSIAVCSSLINNLFPAVKNSNINYILGDAFEFTRYAPELFDVICIDIYTAIECPQQKLESIFWEELSESLTQDGVIVVNTWGLPMHLRPLDSNTHQSKIIELIEGVFRFVTYLPSRRNITILASNTPQSIKQSEVNYEMNEVDQMYFNLFPRRLNTLHNKIPHNSEKSKQEILYLHKEVDKEMSIRNQDFIKDIKNYGFTNITSQNISSYIYNAEKAKNITDILLQEGSYRASFIPNFVSAYAFNGSSGLEWYAEWIINDAAKLIERDEYWFINFGLWQLVTMLANPYAKLDDYIGGVQSIITELK